MELGCSRWQWWMLEIWSPMSLVLLQDLMCAWSRVWLKLVLSLLKVTSGHSLLDGLGAMPQLVLHGVGLRVARWLLMSSSLVLLIESDWEQSWLVLGNTEGGLGEPGRNNLVPGGFDVLAALIFDFGQLRKVPA